MLELAKNLVPDIEKGMPEEIAQAFSKGKIKTIFRTSEGTMNRPVGSIQRLGGESSPGSTYFLTEDGKIARYGRHGKGWGDARSVLGESLDSKRSAFLDETIFTYAQYDKTVQEAGFDVLSREGFNYGLNSGAATTQPTVGARLIEFDSDLKRAHSGHGVFDIYHSTGQVEFPQEAVEAVIRRNVPFETNKSSIDNVEFIKSRNRTYCPSIKIRRYPYIYCF